MVKRSRLKESYTKAYKLYKLRHTHEWPGHGEIWSSSQGLPGDIWRSLEQVHTKTHTLANMRASVHPECSLAVQKWISGPLRGTSNTWCDPSRNWVRQQWGSYQRHPSHNHKLMIHHQAFNSWSTDLLHANIHLRGINLNSIVDR